MQITINDFKPDMSPLARSLHELQGWITYSVADVASVSMLSEDRTLFIENLFVTENCRRKGIGTEVYKLIESAARKSGHTHIGLSIYSRLKDPTAAIAFGKSLGFRIASFDSMHTGMSKTLLGVVPSPEVSESPGVGA